MDNKILTEAEAFDKYLDWHFDMIMDFRTFIWHIERHYNYEVIRSKK